MVRICSLVAGLGNPGKMYAGTRHNVGFCVVDLLAKKHGCEFRTEKKWKGSVARGVIESVETVMLKPLTFMNESGAAVALAMRSLQLDASRILVVADDIDLPMGRWRIRSNSSPGTHKGLKNVQDHLQTNRYARLRIGIGDREEGDLVDHVLGHFSLEEEKLLPEIFERAVHTIEMWLKEGIK